MSELAIHWNQIISALRTGQMGDGQVRAATLGMAKEERSSMLTLVMALGYAGLAEQLRKDGIVPGPLVLPRSGDCTGMFHAGENVLQTMARAYIPFFQEAAPKGGRLTRADALRVVMDEASFWQADINATSCTEHLSPLLLACREQQRAWVEEDDGFIEALIFHGANPNQKGRSCNALSLVLPKGDATPTGWQMFDRLLAFGADPVQLAEVVLARAIQTDVVVHFSSHGGKHPPYDMKAKNCVLGVLSRGTPLVSSKNSEKETCPLAAAIIKGNGEMVERLVQAGASLDWKDPRSGDNLLHVASSEQHEAVRRCAQVLPGDCIPGLIRERNNNGDTPLHVAVEANNLPMVKWLLKAGANPNQENNKGDAPLLTASVAGEVRRASLSDLIGVLHAAGARLSVGDGRKSALHLAAAAMDAKLCQTLIDQGLDASAKDADGLKPLGFAIGQARAIVGKKVGNRQGGWDEKLAEVTRVLLAAGDSVLQQIPSTNSRGGKKKKTTLLHAASQMFFPETCRVLLEAGAQPDLLDANGNTPLNMAFGMPSYWEKLIRSDPAGWDALAGRMAEVFGRNGVSMVRKDAAGMLPFSVFRNLPGMSARILAEQIQEAIGDALETGPQGGRPRM